MADWAAWRFRILMGGARDVIYAVDGLRLWFRPRWSQKAQAGEAIRIGHLAAWRMAPEGEAVAWVVILPGIGDKMEYWAGVQGWLAKRGVGSVVFHYSGYPGSGGRTTPQELEGDGEVVYQWVRERETAPVFVLGFSLGSGIAATIAGRLTPKPAGLVLCSGYTSLRAAARRIVRVAALTRMLPDIWNSVESVRALSVPVLVVHSDGDWLFPIAMAEDVSQGKEFCRLSGWSHNAAHAEVPEDYWQAVLAFLQRQSKSVDGAGTF